MSDEMTWDHRVMRREDGFLEIHEVYYEGEKVSWTENATYPCGETLEEVRLDLERMLRCLEKPILDYETGKET